MKAVAFLKMSFCLFIFIKELWHNYLIIYMFWCFWAVSGRYLTWSSVCKSAVRQAGFVNDEPKVEEAQQRSPVAS